MIALQSLLWRKYEHLNALATFKGVDIDRAQIALERGMSWRSRITFTITQGDKPLWAISYECCTYDTREFEVSAIRTVRGLLNLLPTPTGKYDRVRIMMPILQDMDGIDMEQTELLYVESLENALLNSGICPDYVELNEHETELTVSVVHPYDKDAVFERVKSVVDNMLIKCVALPRDEDAEDDD